MTTYIYFWSRVRTEMRNSENRVRNIKENCDSFNVTDFYYGDFQFKTCNRI
jgi:hypothetical protein